MTLGILPERAEPATAGFSSNAGSNKAITRKAAGGTSILVSHLPPGMGGCVLPPLAAAPTGTLEAAAGVAIVQVENRENGLASVSWNSMAPETLLKLPLTLLMAIC